MKAKVKVASIILALVAITLIGYFAGCGEQRLLTSVGPTEKEEVKNQAAKDMKTVLRRRVPGDKQITNILRTKDESGISSADEEVLEESKVIFNDGHIDYERFGRDVDGDQFSLYERETVYSVKGG